MQGQICATHQSVAKVQETTGETEELGAQRLVVEIGNERVHDRAADRGGEHRGRHAIVGGSVRAHEDAVEAVHHTPERLVVGEEADDHRIAEQRALHAPARDREVDHARNEHLAGVGGIRFGVKKLKEQYLGITGNTVADWMKDLQMDATSMPGKAFDLSFEMPEPDVGIMTFNRCVAVDQWEAMGRPDILEKNCHSTCPKSMIVTTKMYNPNMMVDILAIPPRKNADDVCCKWRFSMRDENDPDYVPLELTKKPTERG
jgi:hypothetical protein